MANGTGTQIQIPQDLQDTLTQIGGGLMGKLNPVAAAGQAIGGLAQVAGSLIGGGARRREQRRARQEMERRKAVNEYRSRQINDPNVPGGRRYPRPEEIIDYMKQVYQGTGLVGDPNPKFTFGAPS